MKIDVRKKSEKEGLIVTASEIRTNPDRAKENMYTGAYCDLQEQKKQVGEVLVLLHDQVQMLLSSDSTNPRARVSLAELINAYAMIHNAALAIEKQLIDTTHKEVDLQKKIEEDKEEVLDPFKVQKLYKEVMKRIEQAKTSGELPEAVISETKDKSLDARTN